MKAQRILMRTFVAMVAVALSIVVVYETGVLPFGELKGDGQDDFVLSFVMELLTICVIPLSLRMFRFHGVACKATTPEGFLRFGMIRLLCLCVPMVANTLLYYLYGNVAFGYMGIILFLCLAFVAPTKERCKAEMSAEDK